MDKRFIFLFILLMTISCICSAAIAADPASSIKSETTQDTNSTKSEKYPLGVIGSVVVAFIGLIGGIMGSIFAPWVHWGIEKRRLKLAHRSELIKEWRSFIEGFDFESQNFGNSTVYGAMRPYMDDAIVKKFEAQMTFYAKPRGGRGDQLFKQWASDQVAMIEKKWKLL